MKKEEQTAQFSFNFQIIWKWKNCFILCFIFQTSIKTKFIYQNFEFYFSQQQKNEKRNGTLSVRILWV